MPEQRGPDFVLVAMEPHQSPPQRCCLGFLPSTGQADRIAGGAWDSSRKPQL